jgi:MFS family permease
MLSWRELRERFFSPSGAGVLVYFLAVQSAVQLAGPYFNPYMLYQLQLPYWQYVVLVAAAYVSRILALPTLGRFAQRFGAKRLLWVGGVGIAPLSAAWLVSNSFAYLIALQLTVGVLWAAYELSTFLLFFEAVADEERTSVLTAFNLANAAATVVGSLVGGMALTFFGKTPATYLALFAVSSVARFMALLLLPRTSRADSSTSEPDSRRAHSASRPVLATLALVGESRPGPSRELQPSRAAG